MSVFNITTLILCSTFRDINTLFVLIFKVLIVELKTRLSIRQGWARDVKPRDRDETLEFRDETEM